MRISIRTRNIYASEDLQSRVERKLESAVDRLKSRIDRVSVLLSDVNGPRGGVDKLCQMTADVRGVGTVLITAIGSDLFEAVANAAERLGYRIHNDVDRRRQPGPDRSTIRAAG